MDEEVWVLLSGGVDSTIMAYVMRQRVRRLIAVTMSVRGADREVPRASTDLHHARAVARWLDVPLHEVKPDRRDVVRVAPTIVRIAETRRASVVDELAGMYHVARYLHRLGVHRVVTGEGPDDIFGVLDFELRFTPPRALRRRMLHNLRHELPFELSAHQKLFSQVGRGIVLVHPYLSRPLVRFALGRPARFLVGKRRILKPLLRMAFAGEVPEEFLWRPKAITRVATGLKRVQEAAYGGHPKRFYGFYDVWQRRELAAADVGL